MRFLFQNGTRDSIHDKHCRIKSLVLQNIWSVSSKNKNSLILLKCVNVFFPPFHFSREILQTGLKQNTFRRIEI